MTLVVRLADKDDLEVCQAHLRRVLHEDLRGYHERWHRDTDDLAGTYLETGVGAARRLALRRVRRDHHGQTGRSGQPTHAGLAGPPIRDPAHRPVVQGVDRA